jgi:hypothetical protein
MAEAIILKRDTEIEADGFGMANVKESIGFRWKTSDDFVVFSRSQIIGNNLADKIKGFCLGGGSVVVRHDLFNSDFLSKKVVEIADHFLPKIAHLDDCRAEVGLVQRLWLLEKPVNVP